MKKRKLKLIAVSFLFALIGSTTSIYAACIECTDGPNPGKCYNGYCSRMYVQGDACCGNTV